MSRKLKLDIPGADRRVSPDEIREKGWEAVFAPGVLAPLPLVVEIGFGRGEFLMQLASESPAQAHLGVEYSYKRVLKMARRLAGGELENLRLVDSRGEDVVRDLLADASVRTFWINYPDPWPKKRHHRRRLIQPGLVESLARRLIPGGELQVATDHAEYAACIASVLAAEPLLENVLAPDVFVREVPGRMATAYELEWRREGRPLHFFHHRRRAV